MFKFVAADPAGSLSNPSKRQHTQRACEPCRRRKKRCKHHPVSPPAHSPEAHTRVAPDLVDSNDSTLSTSPISIEVQAPVTANEQVNSSGTRTASDQRSTGRQEAIIRHLEVEGPARSETGQSTNDTPRSVPTSEALGSRFIGDLNPEAIFLAATSPDTTRGVSLSDSVGIWLTKALSNDSQSPSISSSTQSPSSLFYGSASIVQKVLVPVLEQEALSTIPPADKIDVLSKIYFEKIHPIFPVIDRESFELLQPIDPIRILLQQGICLAASKNLIAKDHLFLQDSQSVLGCRQFGERLSAAMRMAIEIGIVRDKLVLIQALSLMSQFSDNPDSSDYSSQLCGKAVHYVQTIGLHITNKQDEPRGKYGASLFCCVWAIDKMNAAFHGRPVMMHDRDLGRNLEESFNQQDPPFKLLLQVTRLLDKTISLYRPTNAFNDAELEDIFPSYEELVAQCSGCNIPTPLLATIETLYHAVAILSCRSKVGATPRGSSTSSLRQTLASLRLSSATSHDMREQLSLFPFVPYAISLALSIAYRELRHDKIPLYRARARAQFQSNCDFLSDLKDLYWSASVMADMGGKILKEMDRVVSVVAGSEQRRSQRDPTTYNQLSETVVGESVSSVIQPTGAGTSSYQAGGSHPTTVPIQEFDPSLFDSVSNLDIFGLFDPGFDLVGIDACLEGNLDPYMACQNRQTDFFGSNRHNDWNRLPDW